jgi:hypothetical protein
MGALNIAIEIAAKDSGASALINSIKGGLGSLGDLAGGALTLGLGAAAAGIDGLGAGLGLAISEAMGAQEVMSQTEAVIASTGGAAGMTADAIADLAGSLSQNSRFADDAIQEGENLLLTFTNIGSDVFPMATQAMVDMATAMGTDAKSGAIQLGKALNDPVAGISALSRVGVSFTDDQKKMIEQMVKAGDVAGAQKIILAELNKEFGGSAAASAATFAGKLDVIKNQALNVAEAIGGPLITIGSQLIDQFLTPAMPLIEDLGGALTGFIESLAAGDLGDALDGLAEWDSVRAIFDSLGLSGTELYATFGNISSTWDTIVSAFSSIDFGPLQTAFGGLIDALGIQFPTAGETVNGVADGIKVAAQGIADFMNNVLLPGITAVVVWFTENWPTIKATGEEIMTGLQTAIQTALDGIKAFWDEWGDDIMGLWDGFTSGLQGAFDIFKLAFEGKWYEFGEALRGAFDDAWQKIQDLVTEGINWIAEQDWGEIGTNIIQGIANGISSAASLIADAAMTAAKAAYEAVKGFFGIKSPSRLMFALGEFIPMGLAEGIENRSMLPALAMADASMGTYNSARGAVMGGGGMTFIIDARGANDPAAIKRAAKDGVREALREAGINADQRARVKS